MQLKWRQSGTCLRLTTSIKSPWPACRLRLMTANTSRAMSRKSWPRVSACKMLYAKRKFPSGQAKPILFCFVWALPANTQHSSRSACALKAFWFGIARLTTVAKDACASRLARKTIQTDSSMRFAKRPKNSASRKGLADEKGVSESHHQRDADSGHTRYRWPRQVSDLNRHSFL